MAVVPPSLPLPPRFPRPSSMSSATLPARASLSPPLASSPPVFRLCVVPPQECRLSPAVRLNFSTGGRCHAVPGVLSSVPMFWLAPPWPMRLAVLISGLVEGLRRRRPPRCPWLPWRSYRRRLASGLVWSPVEEVTPALSLGSQPAFYALRSFRCSWSSWFRGACLSSAPPPPFPFPVQPYLSRYPPYQQESIFVVVPLALSPSISPWPRNRQPPNRCQGPVPYPPSPFLCHARRPSHLALNRHISVVLWSVPPLRHGRRHGPSLPWLLTTGTM